MKMKKLSPVLSLSISLQLLLSPLPTIAAENNNNNKKVTGADIFNFASGVVNTAVQAYGAMNGANQMQSPQAGQDMAALTQQQTPIPDRYFNVQKLSNIPGLMEYLALSGINPASMNCTSLPATLYEAQNEVCRVGITADKGAPQAQANEAYAYYDQYARIEKLYKNYQSTSNADGQGFGYGCMKKASEILNGFFQYRLNELEKMKTNLEAINNRFKEMSKMDLNAIEESTAVLNGEETKLGAKVRSRRPDLFDYSKRFGTPACNSMFSPENLNRDGKSGGLLGLKDKITQEYSRPSGKFSAEKYTPQAQAEVEADIKKFSNDLGKQIELNFTSILEGKRSIDQFRVGSVNDIPLRPNLFVDADTKFQESKSLLDEEVRKVSAELASAKVPSNIVEMVINPKAGGFSEELTTIENSIKNNCLSRNLAKNFRIFDPRRSKESNKDTNDEILAQINSILESDRSFTQKMQDLKSVNGIRDGRLQISITSDYTITSEGANGELTKVVKKAGVDTPDGYVSGIMKHCDSQFAINKLGNKLSGRDTIKKLKTLKSDFTDLSSKYASDVREEVKKKLLNCSSDTEANASTIGTCTAEAFNISSGGFCAAKAKNCATNMKACQKIAQDFATKTTQERTVRVNNYKNLMQKNKNDIVALFDGVMGKFIQEGEAMRSAFGAGFNAPVDIKREIADGERGKFLEGFDNPRDPLELENPDVFVKMFSQNIDKLKNRVKEQQEQLLGGGGVDSVGGGLIGKHIEEVKSKYSQVAQEAGRLAGRCLAQHDEFVKSSDQANKKAQEEWGKKTGELNDKTNQFCNKYRIAMSSSSPICNGKIDDLVDSVLSVASTSEADAAISNMQLLCTSANNEQTHGSEESLEPKNIPKVCTQDVISKQTNLGIACAEWNSANLCKIKINKDNFKSLDSIQECKQHPDISSLKDKIAGLGENDGYGSVVSDWMKDFENQVIRKSENAGASTLLSEKQIALENIKSNGLPSFCDSNNNSMVNGKGMMGSENGFIDPAAIFNSNRQ